VSVQASTIGCRLTIVPEGAPHSWRMMWATSAMALSMVWALEVVGGVGDPAGNACALAGSDVLRHLEPQVVAWTDVITQPWHPVHVSSATDLAAQDFPQPVQASVLADAQSADAGAARRTPPAPERRAGHPASQAS
jgi:hypothetical protein